MNPTTKISLQSIDKSWTLFLDRDGVLNHEKDNDYVYNYNEFVFYDGVLTALKKFAGLFSKIIVATNQRGVSRGLMTENDLLDIHHKMQEEVVQTGGRIDAIYYCTALESENPNRKPNPGMAFQAKTDHPDIDFKKAIMVGNNISDMEFGRNAGMYTVFLKTTKPNQAIPYPAIDWAFNSLLNFAETLP